MTRFHCGGVAHRSGAAMPSIQLLNVANNNGLRGSLKVDNSTSGPANVCFYVETGDGFRSGDWRVASFLMCCEQAA